MVGYDDLDAYAFEHPAHVRRVPGETVRGYHVENPSIVMRLDGHYDVIAFGPLRRLATRVSRTVAEDTVTKALATRSGR